MFVTVQDFYANSEYPIPNVESVINSFRDFISKQEQKFLREIFGPSLYTDFNAGLLEVPILTKWTRLRDGYNYTYGDLSLTYGGLKEILIPWIFARWVESHVFNYSGLGFSLPSSENSEMVSPARAICAAHNEAVRLIGYSDYYGFVENDTLYSYLVAYPADYTNTRFTDIEPINAWQI